MSIRIITKADIGLKAPTFIIKKYKIAEVNCS